MFRIENELIALGTEINSSLFPEKDEGKDIAILCAQSALVSSVRNQVHTFSRQVKKNL